MRAWRFIGVSEACRCAWRRRRPRPGLLEPGPFAIRWHTAADAARSDLSGPIRPDPVNLSCVGHVAAHCPGGYKAHTSVDRRFRLIRCRDVTDASRYDGRLLRKALLNPTSTGAGMWADTAYRSKRNETWLQRHRFISHIHRRRPSGRSPPAHIRRGNARCSRDRATVEHVLAVQKQAMGLAVRTVGLARARTVSGWPTSPTSSGESSSYRAASPPDAASWSTSVPTAESGAKKPLRRGSLRLHYPISRRQTPIPAHRDF